MLHRTHLQTHSLTNWKLVCGFWDMEAWILVLCPRLRSPEALVTHTHTPPRPTRVRTFILNSLVPRYRNVPFVCRAVSGWIFCYKFKFLIIICKKMFNLDINHVRAGVLGLSSTDIRPGGGRRSRSRWDDGCWMWVLLCVRSGDDELRFHHQGRENALEGRMAQRAP